MFSYFINSKVPVGLERPSHTHAHTHTHTRAHAHVNTTGMAHLKSSLVFKRSSALQERIVKKCRVRKHTTVATATSYAKVALFSITLFSIEETSHV